MNYRVFVVFCGVLSIVGCGKTQGHGSEVSSVSQDEVTASDQYVPAGGSQVGVKEILVANDKEEAAGNKTEFDAQKSDGAGNICIFDIALPNRNGVIHEGYILRAQDKVDALLYKVLLGLQTTAPNLERNRFSRSYFRSSLGVKVELAYSQAQQNCVTALRTSYESALVWHQVMLNFESVYPANYRAVNHGAVVCAAKKYLSLLPQAAKVGQATINGTRAAVDYLLQYIVYQYSIDDTASIANVTAASVAAFQAGRPAAAAMLQTAAQCWDGQL